MPKFLMRVDLAVGSAQLKNDPDGPPIDVCSLCIIHEEHGVIWMDTTAFPIGTWALDAIKDRAQFMEAHARQNWPQVYAATDWFIPNAEEFKALHGLETFSGQL